MEQLKKMSSYGMVGLLTFLLACQPDHTFNHSVDEFIIKDGFEIEVIAAEPLLDSPMAMTFDEEGRIWIVELPGYMRDIDGSDEELPDGKIVILEDENGDGIMDTRKVFIDSLKTPRAIALAYGGLMYTETPNLWWVPIENDRPRERELIDSLYVVGGNIEHQPNGLLYNLDNWFYSAKSNARYRRINGKWKKEVTTFRGQWGITHDDEGRLFYNSNSNPLQTDFSFPNQLINNPFHKASAGVRKTLDSERRLYPIQPTSVNRGYNDGVLDSLGFLQKFTSACSPLIYRGNQFPDDFQGNAFVCGPEANLIKRYVLNQENGRIIAENAYENSEFLISKDESFRPINLYNGLDGSMYVLDLRKGVIQHRAYMTNYLREEILAKRLDTVNRIGRIYRITSTENKISTIPDFANLSNEELIELLKHPNGKLRSFAQQKLIFKNQLEAETQIKTLLLDNSAPLGQIHALWTLEGLGILKVDDLVAIANTTSDERVWTQLLRLLPLFPEAAPELIPVIDQAMTLNSASVDLQLCHIVGQINAQEAGKYWLDLASKYAEDELYSEALISGIHGKEEQLYSTLNQLNVRDTLQDMLALTISNVKEDKNEAPKLFTAEFEDGRTRGFNLYSTYCASCHGLDGHGVENLAPPIYHSEYISQSTEQLILIALHGLKGPIEVNGKRYDMGAVMPGIKDNPALNDQDIAAILSFVRNSLSEYPGRIRSRDIEAIRKKTSGQNEMFTAESLKEWLQENGVGE